MAMMINTNTASINAQRHLNTSRKELAIAMERLSSGQRINSAKDDAAGLAIRDKMTAQIEGLRQAVRNTNDAISLAQTAEGAMEEITSMLQRMRTLSVQAINDTNSSSDRQALNDEVVELKAEINRIADTSVFNNIPLLRNGYSGTFQIGHQAGDTITLSFNAASTSGSNISLLTSDNAASALTTIDQAIQYVSSQRSVLGAFQNRLSHATSNLSNMASNTESARSVIADADYATESTRLAKAQILQQAGTAMLAQANSMAQSVLSLLK